MFMPMMSFPKRYIYITGIVIIAPQTKLSFSHHFSTKKETAQQGSHLLMAIVHAKVSVKAISNISRLVVLTIVI
ncbi:hypothetical protein [Paenibacillus sp. 2KB_22]|uniref:hypothetical protein n=1 Tax=Paenibacillus sp. 2KB_22 TaxID=3232978 RepID=UPI003F9E8AF0